MSGTDPARYKRNRYSVVAGYGLTIAALFLPVVRGALFPDHEVPGWMVAVLGASALFEMGRDDLANLLASLFLTNLLFLILTAAGLLLKGRLLKTAFFLGVVNLVFNLTVTAWLLPQTRFSVGQVAWLLGLGLLTLGLYREGGTDRR